MKKTKKKQLSKRVILGLMLIFLIGFIALTIKANLMEADQKDKEPITKKVPLESDNESNFLFSFPQYLWGIGITIIIFRLLGTNWRRFVRRNF